MPDNRIDKPRLDPPTLLINSSATWLFVHAQKISRPVSIVTAAMRMRISGTRPFSNLIKKKLPSRIIEVPDNGGPDNQGSTVHAHTAMPVHFWTDLAFVQYVSQECTPSNVLRTHFVKQPKAEIVNGLSLPLWERRVEGDGRGLEDS